MRQSDTVFMQMSHLSLLSLSVLTQMQNGAGGGRGGKAV